ncbi:hypothetical protein SDC9_33217 [bioreactor metagenome]|uniref:Glycosyltransferase 2-like domain-containing protein n=1 Tax=bioreactor metagenome TaxID=1076179 RepID=A0A644V8Y7_9ZZZZ|nr:glycosyltransferase family 2 protein [Candidatus Elulimicrobiales bacterium]
MNIEILLHALIFIVLIDGIKILIETCYPYKKQRRFSGENNKVTAIIAAYNEENVIINTITSLSKILPLENIIVVDDGSKDGTSQKIKDLAPGCTLITTKNRGKVNALHTGLEKVKTPYVLLLDADILLPSNFIIPTDALKDGEATAVSFNIMPIIQKRSFWTKLCSSFQMHEYMKSMQIGRRFADKSKSVHCISGAAGLFMTKRLRELSQQHTTIFPGEDLERTLLELTSDGKVIFSESTVFTEVPYTFRDLARQRIIGWWPGLWRNILLFLKLIFKKKSSATLRYELLYEIFSLLTSPLRIISLIGLIIFKQWQILLLIFFFYLFLEIVSYIKIRKIKGKRYLKLNGLVIGSYNFYSIFQTFTLFFAFFVFVKKQFFSNEWRKLATIFIAFLTSTIFGTGKAQEQKKDWSANVRYSYLTDVSKDRTFHNIESYLSYKNFYTTLNTSPYYGINLGAYIKSFTVDTRYNWKANTWLFRLRYDYWAKNNWVPYLAGSYGVSPYSQEKTDSAFPTLEVGLNKYLADDLSRIGIGVSKEFGRLHGTTFQAKVKLVKNKFWTDFGASINNFGHPGGYLDVGYGIVYIHGSYYDHFDFNNFARTSLGAGIKLKF